MVDVRFSVRTNTYATMKYLSVFSGIEAASVAWKSLGWEAVGFSEIEPFPCAVLKHRFPNTPNYGDITKYNDWPIEPGTVNLLIGGSPCQSFSVAGLRKGLADPRGNLALVFLGLADKIRPRWIVWENVPGVLSSNGGRDFGSFVGALEQLGYGWAMRVLDAQYFGVPQRRRRVFVVASLGGRDVAASVLLKPESLCWHPAKGRKKGQATAADAGSGVEAGSPVVIDRAAFNQGINAQYEPHIEQTDIMDSLVAKGPHAVGVPLCASNTLNNFDLGDTRTTHAVVEPICFEPRSQDGHARISGDLSPTLNTAQGGQRQPCIATPMAVRRLTPIECERLQGFPDNWSRIPWKGKPEDQCPDGPRYKACGNSMAVPVMRWIGEQIARVESKKI